MLKHLDPFRHGRWLARLMYDLCSPDEDMPSRRHLTFGTRHATSTHVDHYSSEPAPAMVPSLELRLTRFDVSTWPGTHYRLWRTHAATHLLAGVHRVVLTEDRSFTHEDNARQHYSGLFDLRAQICDPPADGWVNPAPWRPDAIPVGDGAAWCQHADPCDRSDLYWLNALGLELMVRRRDDGTYVHLDTENLPHHETPLLVEVNNSGTTVYELPRGDRDD